MLTGGQVGERVGRGGGWDAMVLADAEKAPVSDERRATEVLPDGGQDGRGGGGAQGRLEHDGRAEEGPREEGRGGALVQEAEEAELVSASVSAFSLRPAARRTLGDGATVRNFRRLLAASRRALYMSVDYESEGQRFDSSRAHHFTAHLCLILDLSGRGYGRGRPPPPIPTPLMTTTGSGWPHSKRCARPRPARSRSAR